MKKQVIALNMHRGAMKIGNTPIKLNLPKGCVGMCFVFESKKTAKEYWGNNVPLIEITQKIKTLKKENKKSWK